MMNAEVPLIGENDQNGSTNVYSIEQTIIKKKQEKFQLEIRNSKKKEILNQNRVRIFQKYILETSQDTSTVKQLIPEHIYTNPSNLNVYVDELIEGFKRDFENYIPTASRIVATQNNTTEVAVNLLPKSLNHLRMLSSLKNSFSILQQIVLSDIHPMILHLMGRNNDRGVRLDAGWLLTNILTVDLELVNRIATHNYKMILDLFTSMYLEEADADFNEIGTWGITNLMIECEEAVQVFYDTIGFANFEEKYARTSKHEKQLDTLAWMVSIFSKSWKILSQDDKQMFLRLAEQQVLNPANENIQACGIRVLYYISNDEGICSIIAQRQRLIEKLLFISNISQEQVSYCIAIIGNLLSCTSDISKILLKNNILEHLSIALDSARSDVRKEALWCIANLLSGDEEEIQSILDFTRLIEKIFSIAKIDCIQNVHEICVGMSNCLSRANNFQISRLISLGILEIFVLFLSIQDVNIILKTLQGLGFLLDYGENVRQSDQLNPVKFTLQSLGFNQILLSLQYHPLEMIYDLTNEILVDYYSDKLRQIKNPYDQESRFLEDQEI